MKYLILLLTLCLVGCDDDGFKIVESSEPSATAKGNSTDYTINGFNFKQAGTIKGTPAGIWKGSNRTAWVVTNLKTKEQWLAVDGLGSFPMEKEK